MSIDNNGRRHDSEGRPTGGRFLPEKKAADDTSLAPSNRNLHQQFQDDFAGGKRTEQLVADILGATMYEDGDDFDRDAGDMHFCGFPVEVKHDRAFDKYGNAAIEFADVQKDSARITGVAKSMLMCAGSIYVHKLGDADLYMVYSPSDMVALMSKANELPWTKVRSTPNRRGDRVIYETYNLIISNPVKNPRPEYYVIADSKSLATAVRQQHARTRFHAAKRILDAVRSLADGKSNVTPLPGALKVKEFVGDTWHVYDKAA